MTERKRERDKLWGQCPPGAIQEVADTAVVTRATIPMANLQRRRLLVASAVAAGVAVFGGVSYLATREPAWDNSPVLRTGDGGPIATFDFGGINCIEVVRNIHAYVASDIDDSEMTESIKQHLEHCEKCRDVYEYNMDI